MTSIISTPGIVIETRSEPVRQAFPTAAPLFLGYVSSLSGTPTVQRLTQASQFAQFFATASAAPRSYLRQAVAGFFANGGEVCYVASLLYDAQTPLTTLATTLTRLAALPAVDLVCAPDLMVHLPGQPAGELRQSEIATIVELQRVILEHCDQVGDRFAILDAVSHPNATAVADRALTPVELHRRQQIGLDLVARQRQLLSSVNGALYFPWLRADSPHQPDAGFAPPCGHVAGIFARSDRRNGVHKAPANERLAGVNDLQFALDDRQQGPLNAAGINCLRAFPGRGIRVWGARTLSDDPRWRYINVRRLVLTIGRWAEQNLAGLVFEPNDPRLWARIRRELTVYLTGLFQQGALRGRSAAEAFYVKCDEETNPTAQRETGRLVTEIGLAPVQPGEFIVVRIVHR